MSDIDLEGKISSAISSAQFQEEANRRARAAVADSMNWSLRKWLGALVVTPIVMGLALGVPFGLIFGSGVVGVGLFMVGAGFTLAYQLIIFSVWAMKRLARSVFGR